MHDGPFKPRPVSPSIRSKPPSQNVETQKHHYIPNNANKKETYRKICPTPGSNRKHVSVGSKHVCVFES
jgi:hypothetical protein